MPKRKKSKGKPKAQPKAKRKSNIVGRSEVKIAREMLLTKCTENFERFLEACFGEGRKTELALEDVADKLKNLISEFSKYHLDDYQRRQLYFRWHNKLYGNKKHDDTFRKNYSHYSIIQHWFAFMLGNSVDTREVGQHKLSEEEVELLVKTIKYSFDNFCDLLLDDDLSADDALKYLKCYFSFYSSLKKEKLSIDEFYNTWCKEVYGDDIEQKRLYDRFHTADIFLEWLSFLRNDGVELKESKQIENLYSFALAEMISRKYDEDQIKQFFGYLDFKDKNLIEFISPYAEPQFAIKDSGSLQSWFILMDQILRQRKEFSEPEKTQILAVFSTWFNHYMPECKVKSDYTGHVEGISVIIPSLRQWLVLFKNYQIDTMPVKKKIFICLASNRDLRFLKLFQEYFPGDFDRFLLDESANLLNYSCWYRNLRLCKKLISIYKEKNRDLYFSISFLFKKHFSTLENTAFFQDFKDLLIDTYTEIKESEAENSAFDIVRKLDISQTLILSELVKLNSDGVMPLAVVSFLYNSAAQTRKIEDIGKENHIRKTEQIRKAVRLIESVIAEDEKIDWLNAECFCQSTDPSKANFHAKDIASLLYFVALHLMNNNLLVKLLIVLDKAGLSDIKSQLIKTMRFSLEGKYNGCTGLGLAIHEGNIQVVETFLKYGIDHSIVDGDGKKTVDYLLMDNIGPELKLELIEIFVSTLGVKELDQIKLLIEGFSPDDRQQNTIVNWKNSYREDFADLALKWCCEHWSCDKQSNLKLVCELKNFLKFLKENGYKDNTSLASKDAIFNRLIIGDNLEDAVRKTDVAIEIQRQVRGWLVRTLKRRRNEKLAISKIKATVRSYLDRMKNKKAATKIQAYFRGASLRQKKKAQQAEREKAAVRIQARFRGNSLRQAEKHWKRSKPLVFDDLAQPTGKKDETAKKLIAYYYPEVFNNEEGLFFLSALDYAKVFDKEPEDKEAGVKAFLESWGIVGQMQRELLLQFQIEQAIISKISLKTSPRTVTGEIEKGLDDNFERENLKLFLNRSLLNWWHSSVSAKDNRGVEHGESDDSEGSGASSAGGSVVVEGKKATEVARKVATLEESLIELIDDEVLNIEPYTAADTAPGAFERDGVGEGELDTIKPPVEELIKLKQKFEEIKLLLDDLAKDSQEWWQGFSKAKQELINIYLPLSELDSNPYFFAKREKFNRISEELLRSDRADAKIRTLLKVKLSKRQECSVRTKGVQFLHWGPTVLSELNKLGIKKGSSIRIEYNLLVSCYTEAMGYRHKLKYSDSGRNKYNYQKLSNILLHHMVNFIGEEGLTLESLYNDYLKGGKKHPSSEDLKILVNQIYTSITTAFDHNDLIKLIILSDIYKKYKALPDFSRDSWLNKNKLWNVRYIRPLLFHPETDYCKESIKCSLDELYKLPFIFQVMQRHNQQQSALKIQALHRGRMIRKSISQRLKLMALSKKLKEQEQDAPHLTQLLLPEKISGDKRAILRAKQKIFFDLVDKIHKVDDLKDKCRLYEMLFGFFKLNKMVFYQMRDHVINAINQHNTFSHALDLETDLSSKIDHFEDYLVTLKHNIAFNRGFLEGNDMLGFTCKDLLKQCQELEYYCTATLAVSQKDKLLKMKKSIDSYITALQDYDKPFDSDHADILIARSKAIIVEVEDKIKANAKKEAKRAQAKKYLKNALEEIDFPEKLKSRTLLQRKNWQEAKDACSAFQRSISMVKRVSEKYKESVGEDVLKSCVFEFLEKGIGAYGLNLRAIKFKGLSGRYKLQGLGCSKTIDEKLQILSSFMGELIKEIDSEQKRGLPPRDRKPKSGQSVVADGAAPFYTGAGAASVASRGCGSAVPAPPAPPGVAPTHLGAAHAAPSRACAYATYEPPGADGFAVPPGQSGASRPLTPSYFEIPAGDFFHPPCLNAGAFGLGAAAYADQGSTSRSPSPSFVPTTAFPVGYPGAVHAAPGGCAPPLHGCPVAAYADPSATAFAPLVAVSPYGAADQGFYTHVAAGSRDLAPPAAACDYPHGAHYQ